MTSNGMKKILILSTAYLPFVGGAEISIKEITSRIKSEYNFDLITARMQQGLPRVEVVGSVTVYRVGIGVPFIDKLWLPVGGALLARSLHKKKHYDLQWVVMVSWAALAAKFARLGVPFIVTLQEGDSEAHFSKRWFGLIDISWRSVLARADAVTAISTYLAKRGKRLGFRGEPYIVPNGVDIAHFTQEHHPRIIDETKDKLGKRMGDVFLVTASRLVYKNAVDVCIAALKFLPENVRLVVIGSGPLEKELRASSFELRDRVQFVGHVGHDELPKYLKACDIFIRPSRSEGMGNAFIEAFAAGLPVIATQEGGISDFLFDEKRNPDKPVTGFAVDKDSPEQVAAQVKNIMEHSEKVRAVVATARELAKEKYDWALIARAMGSVFARISQGA